MSKVHAREKTDDRAEAEHHETLAHDEPQHIDAVVRRSGLAAATVSGTLDLLELKGLVRDVGGMQFGRGREDEGDYATAESAGRAAGAIENAL